LIYNYFRTDVLGILEKEKLSWQDIKLTPSFYEELISLLVQNKISSRVAKDLLVEVIRTGKRPTELIQEKGLGLN